MNRGAVRIALGLGLGLVATATTAQRPNGPVVALGGAEAGLIAASAAGLARRATDDGPWQPLVELPAGHRPVAFACGRDGGPDDGSDGGFVAALAPGVGGAIVRFGARPGVLHVDFEIEALAWDGGDRLVVGGADGALRRVDPGLGADAVGPPIPLHAGPCRDLAFDPAGTRLAAAGRDGTLGILGPGRDERVVIRDHSAGVECVAWSADGAVLASGARDGRVRFHDRSGRLLRSTPPQPAAVLALAGTATGDFVFADAVGRVARTDAEPDAPIDTLARLDEPVFALLADRNRLWIGGFGRIHAISAGR